MGQGPSSSTVASCHTNSGTLLHGHPSPIARSPETPSPPSMHDPELVVCGSLPKGLLAALVVPPPPTPPILLETSQQRITRELTKHHQGGHNRGPNFGSSSWPILAGPPPLPLVALRCAAVSGEPSRHHPRDSSRESTHPISRGAFRIPAAPKVLHRLLVFAGDSPSIWAIATQPPCLYAGTFGNLIRCRQTGTFIAMSVTITQSAMSAAAASKQRLITPESAILRGDAGMVVWRDATTPQRTC